VERRDVPLARQADGTWRRLFGIDVEMAPGQKVLTLRGTAHQPAVEGTHTFDVAPKAVRTRRIRVNRSSSIHRRARGRASGGSRAAERALPPAAERGPVVGRERDGRWKVSWSSFGVRSVLNGRRADRKRPRLAAVTGTPVTPPAPAWSSRAAVLLSGNTVIPTIIRSLLDIKHSRSST
jgi:hypothetical protein